MGMEQSILTILAYILLFIIFVGIIIAIIRWLLKIDERVQLLTDIKGELQTLNNTLRSRKTANQQPPAQNQKS